TPTFSGTAEASSTVKLYRAGSTQIGSVVASASGTWSIMASALPAGVNAITATATDAAGNISAATGTLNVTIDTTAPGAPPTPDMAAGSDSGSSNTDNITNVTTPSFSGTAEAGSTVKL